MLTNGEISLVGLGASIGANCIPCAVYHIKKCRQSGFSDEQIRSAVDVAVRVKSVPADNVLSTALRQLEATDGAGRDCGDEKCTCV